MASFIPTGRSGVLSLRCEVGLQTGFPLFVKDKSWRKIKQPLHQLQFPIDKPLPNELISEIVRFRAAENISRAEGKLEKRK